MVWKGIGRVPIILKHLTDLYQASMKERKINPLIQKFTMILLISEITKIMGEDFCLVDSAKTLTILKDEKYFQQLTLSKVYVNTISGSLNQTEGFERANIMLPKGTKICIDDALYVLF